MFGETRLGRKVLGNTTWIFKESAFGFWIIVKVVLNGRATDSVYTDRAEADADWAAIGS